MQTLKSNCGFSGHSHLGQCYEKSTNKVGKCLFIHTGVITNISRDGFHQSRFLEFGDQGCLISTLDHVSGQCNIDVSYEFKTNTFEVYTQFQAMPGVYFSPPEYPKHSPWIIGNSIFTIHRDMLVEFDIKTQDAIGVVADKLKDKEVIVEHNKIYIIHSNQQRHEIKAHNGRFVQSTYKH